MIKAFFYHHFQDLEHTGKFLVNFAGIASLVGFIIFLIGLPFVH